jgi:hypothetical protein
VNRRFRQAFAESKPVLTVLRTHDFLFETYANGFVVSSHSAGNWQKLPLKYGTLKIVANFCRVPRVVGETRNDYA